VYRQNADRWRLTVTTTTADLKAIMQQLNRLDEQVRQLRSLVVGQSAATKTDDSSQYVYVTRDPAILRNEPIIRGTRTPVRAIVEHWKFGDAPETIVRKLPHLRLAQVFDALSYYDDHRAEIEQYIAANRVPVDD
jgi:uncharacterized protein (DUF433 family)